MIMVIVFFLYLPVLVWHLCKICNSNTQEELDRAGMIAFSGVGVMAVALAVCFIVEVLFFARLSALFLRAIL